MSIKSTVNCPDCGSPIYIESSLLLAGHKFSCTNPQCSVSIAISSSEIEKVSETYTSFQSMKESTIKQSGYSEQ